MSLMFSEFMVSERTRHESLSMAPTPFTEVQTQIERSNSSGKSKRISMASECSTVLHPDIDSPLIRNSGAKRPDVSLDNYHPISRKRRSSACKVVKIIKCLRSVCSCISRRWKIRIERKKWPQMNGRDEDIGGTPRGVGGRGLMDRNQVSFSGSDMVAIAPVETGAMNQLDTMGPPPPYDAPASAYSLPSCPPLPHRPLSSISSSHPLSYRDTVSVTSITTDENNYLHQNAISTQIRTQDAFNLGNLFRSSVTVRLPFKPRNQNELEVTIGEKLRILGIFYNGWCCCQTEGGRRGDVPMACLQIPSGNEPENISFPGTDLGRVYFHDGLERSPAVPLYTAIVLRPFISSRGDQLSVTVGENLVVLGEIGGGWAKCSRRGEVGMVPLACFDASRSTRLANFSTPEPDVGVEYKSGEFSARICTTDPSLQLIGG